MPRSLQNGMLLMAFAALLFAGMSALAKLAAQQVPSSEVVFFRSLLASLILLAIHGSRRQAGPWLGKRRGLLLLRGTFGAAGLLLYFYALDGLAVADAMLLNQCSPLFVLFLAVPFLGEKLRWVQILVVPFTAAGVLLVLRPDLDLVNPYGLAGFASAALAGSAYVCVRKLTRTEPSETIILYFAVLSTAISAPLMFADFRWPDGATWLFLAGVGLLSVGAQLLLTAAYRREKAGRVAMVGTIGPVFAGLLDLAIWNRLPDWPVLLGAFLILGSLLALHRQGRRSQPDSPKRS